MISAFRFVAVAPVFSRRLVSFRAGSSPSRMFSSAVSPTTQAFTLNERKPIVVTASSGEDFSSDLLVIPFFQFDKFKADTIEKFCGSKDADCILSTVSSVIADGSFKGKLGTDQIIRLSASSNAGSKYLALVGLGNEKRTTSFSAAASTFPVNDAMNFGKTVMKLAEKVNARSVGITVLDSSLLPKECLSQILMGIYDGSYQDTRFKKQTDSLKEDKHSKTIEKITFLNGFDENVVELKKSIDEISKRIEAINNGVDFAKDIVGMLLSSLLCYYHLDYLLLFLMFLISLRCSSEFQNTFNHSRRSKEVSQIMSSIRM
jgi:hypothetical protein